MNAAEELERMAVEIEQAAKGRALAADKYKGADREQRLLCESNGLCEAARALRHRAAELRAGDLRARHSEPTYKPQPKPAEVRERQWWSADGEEPRRVVVVRYDGHDRYAQCGAINGVPIDYYESEMLNSSAFLYHGDSEQPGLVGSEVAGEEER